jgi:PAS domain S-box-containing protein
MILRGWADGLARRSGIAHQSPALLVSLALLVLSSLILIGAVIRPTFFGSEAWLSADVDEELAEAEASYATLDLMLDRGRILADFRNVRGEQNSQLRTLLVQRLADAERLLAESQALMALDSEAHRTLSHLTALYQHRPEGGSSSAALLAALPRNENIDSQVMASALRSLSAALAERRAQIHGSRREQASLHRRMAWSLVFVLAASCLPVMYGFRLQRRMRDIQAELDARQQRFDRQLCAMPGAMLIATAEGQILQCSDTLAALLGYKRSQLLGKNIEMLIPPRLHQQYRVLVRNSLHARQGDFPAGREMLVRCKSDQELAVELHLSTCDIEGGMGLMVCFRDIREERALYERYRESQKRFDLAAMASRDGLWDWNLSSGKIFLSHSWQQMMKWPAIQPGEELEQFWETIPDQDRLPLREALKRFLAGGGYLFTYEHRVKCGDGELRDMVCRASAQRDSNGRVIRLVGVYSDVTPFKQREREIKRLNRKLEDKVRLSSFQLEEALENADSANRAISAFLSVTGHEIRTPMNGVVGMTELLAKTELDREQRVMLDTLSRSSQKLLSTLDNILDYAALEAGTLSLVPQSVQLAEFIESIADSVATDVARNHQQFYLSLDPDLPRELQLDPQRVRQMLQALLENAVKFSAHSRPAGRIELQVLVERTTEAESLLFRVIDNGIGVSSEVRSKLFRPFVQADTSLTRRFSGTGLGLAIARHLARLMGGKVTLEDGEAGHTCFVASIPMDVGTAPRALPAPVREEVVAVVSDELLEKSLKFALGARGIAMRSCKDAAAFTAAMAIPEGELTGSDSTAKRIIAVISNDESGEVLRRSQQQGLKHLLLTARPANGSDIGAEGVVYTNPLLPSVLFLALERLKQG